MGRKTNKEKEASMIREMDRLKALEKKHPLVEG
jgi:hypothetical protein